MKIAKYFRRVKDYFKEQEVFLELVSRFLMICLEILSPTKICKGKKKISRLFSAMFVSMTGICLFLLWYTVIEFKSMSLMSLSVNVGIFIIALKFFSYLLYIAFVFNDISQLVHRLINEKKAKMDENTFKHGKEEFIGVLLLVVQTALLAFCICVSIFFFKVNENNLPLNFRLTFLTLESVGIEWTINYVLQVTFMAFSVLGYITFFLLMFLLMNHSCWEIDQTVLLLTDWSSDESDKNASELIKSVVKRSCGVLGYMNESQRLLKFFFFVEISSQSISLCTVFYSILVDPPGNFTTFSMICVQLTQAFMVCWLGNRVIIRIDALTAAIYDLDWYKFAPTDRKSLQIVLMMAQNIHGYNGIFHEVKMETFQKILEFAYSYMMFMRSVNLST